MSNYRSPSIYGIHAYPPAQPGGSTVEAPYVHPAGSHIGLPGGTVPLPDLGGLGGHQPYGTAEQDPNYKTGYTQGYVWAKQHGVYATRTEYQNYLAALRSQGFVEAFLKGWLAGYVDASHNRPSRF